MNNSTKIIGECKNILKKHGIKYCEDFKVFKKSGLIHCQIEDWRGPTELDGFPVFTEKAAVGLLVVSCAFSHYCYFERDNREKLSKEYPSEYGEYESRKIIFESILNILKDYDADMYQTYIEKYTKYINTNRTAKEKWVFNTDLNKFETHI